MPPVEAVKRALEQQGDLDAYPDALSVTQKMRGLGAEVVTLSDFKYLGDEYANAIMAKLRERALGLDTDEMARKPYGGHLD